MPTPREDIVAAMNQHLQAAQGADGAYADIRARCAGAGLNFDQVSVEDAGRTSWDDGEVVVGADGQPTVLAKTMVDTEIVVHADVDGKLVPREVAVFNAGCRRMFNKCVAVPARTFAVGTNEDGSPIPWGSATHKLMIVLDLFRQYLHQQGRTLAQATAADKKQAKLWREKLLAQDVSSTQAAVYFKVLISNDLPDEAILYKVKQHAYSARLRTCCMHIGGHQTVFTTDPDRDKTLGYFDYEAGDIKYFAREVTRTSLEDAVAEAPESPPKKQRVEEKASEAPAMVQQRLPLVDSVDPTKYFQGTSTVNCVVMLNGELKQYNPNPVTRGGGATRGFCRTKGATRGAPPSSDSEEEDDDVDAVRTSVCMCNLMPSERTLAPLRQLSTQILPGHYFELPTSISASITVMVNVTDLNRDGAAKMVGDIATLYQNLHADLQAAQGGGGGGKSTFGYRHEVTPFDAAAATAKDKATVMANLGSMPKITSAELDSFRTLLDSE